MVSLSLSVPILLRILKVYLYLPKSVSVAMHNLFLSQMADKMFKKNLAIAYAEGYVEFTRAYGCGFGTIDYSVFSLSVQFLNRDHLVLEIVENHQFFLNICLSIESMLISAFPVAEEKSDSLIEADRQYMLQSEKLLVSQVLTHRRYNPMLSDLKVSEIQCLTSCRIVSSKSVKFCDSVFVL